MDSVSAYYAGGLPIKSWQPTSATYVACREHDQLPCWLLYSQQVLHQRWISGIHGTQATKHASEGSTLALKPRGDVIRSPKQGYQWPHKKNSCPPKIYKKKKLSLRNIKVNVAIHYNIEYSRSVFYLFYRAYSMVDSSRLSTYIISILLIVYGSFR